MIKSYKFEVSVEVKGKPQIDGIFSSEPDALARAEYLLGLAKFTAVRVIQIDARESTKVIFEKTYSGGGKTATISEIDQAYYCKTIFEVYGADSRATLARLMRRYCDEQVLIPAEILHQYMMLRMLERETGLFNSALHRLAAIQARRGMLKPEARTDELSRLFRELLAFAKTADSLNPYAVYLAEHGLGGLLAHLADTVAAGEQSRVITFAVARALEDQREWTAKVTTLCEMFGNDPNPAVVTLLDEFLAEAIDGNVPIRTLIGYAPDLVTALMSLAAVTTGKLNDRYPGTPALFDLNRAMMRFELPRCQSVLIGAIARSLDGTAALTRSGNGADALRRLMPMLQEYGGFKGRGPMCAAVTRRAKTVFAAGIDDLSLEAAVEQVMAALPGAADRIGYLLDLLTTDIGNRKANWLTAKLGEIFAAVKSMREFLPDSEAVLEGKSIAEHFRPRLFGGGIPQDLAGRFLQRLEWMALAEERAGGAPMIPKLPPRKPVATVEPIGETIDFSSMVGSGPNRMPAHVVFTYQGETFVCSPDRQIFVLGRNPDCDLIVTFGGASRAHAKVYQSGDQFILLDQSKNGTYVKIKNQPAQVLKGESINLNGNGTIFLGADPSIDSAEDSHSISFIYIAAT